MGRFAPLNVQELGGRSAGSVEIILATGQSNMRRSAALAWVPPSNLRVWNGTSTSVGTAFTPADPTTVNPATVFAARLAERDRSRTYYVINISDDGELVAQWLSTASSGVLMWDAVTANVEAALAVLGRTKVNRLLWWQGEADAGQSFTWEAQLTTVWGQFIGESWFPLSTPAMMFELNARNATYASLIRSQKRFCERNDENWTFVSQAHLRAGVEWDADAAHLTAAGMVASGEAAVAALTKSVGRPVDREVLYANRTYYVRLDGNDSNTGLENSAEGAFATVAKALSQISFYLDLNGYNVTVQLGDGTHARVTHSQSFVGGGYVNINGNSASPGNVVFGGIAMAAAGEIRLNHMQITATGTYAVAASANGARVFLISNILLGAASGAHLNASGQGARVAAFAAYTINGAAPKHIEVLQGGQFTQNAAVTVTLTGTPAFSTAFAFADRGGVIDFSATPTYSGAATGKRYQADRLSLINANGTAGASFFPGNAAGTTATGGQYT